MAHPRTAEPAPSDISTNSSREILATRVTLLDVRSPTEFARAAFPGSANLPLLDDEQRHSVGIAYKEHGPDRAIALGHELLGGGLREERVAGWRAFVSLHRGALVVCARGGLRSQIATEWLAETGVDAQRVSGGIKALRGEALAVIAAASQDRDWIILGGKTGCGKTALLSQIADHLDFEAAANHRGSSFGGHATPQPAQATFENRLAVELLGHRGKRLVVEDEGRNLGTLALPEAMVARMRRSPVVVVECSFEQRIENIYDDYLRHPIARGEAPSDLCERYRAALGRLRKRLGDERWRELDGRMEEAFNRADDELHRAWISGVLTAYYDPMYDYQLGRKADRVVMTGTSDDIRAHFAAKEQLE